MNITAIVGLSVGVVLLASCGLNAYLLEKVSDYKADNKTLSDNVVKAKKINDELVKKREQDFKKILNLAEKQSEAASKRDANVAKIQSIRPRIRKVSIAKPKIISRIASRAVIDRLRKLEEVTDPYGAGEWVTTVSPATTKSSKGTDKAN